MKTFTIEQLCELREKQSSRVLGKKTFSADLCTAYVPSPCEIFNFVETKSCDGPRTIFQSDISMLLNQKRLDRLSSQLLDSYLGSYIAGAAARKAPSGNYTTEQLSMFVKSRYCQSPSELMAWSAYLDLNYDNLSQELQAMVDAQKTGTTSPDSSSEPKLE